MEKTGLQILSEIREALSVISGKMAEVELQLAELEGFMDFEGAEAVPTPDPAPAPVVPPPAPTPSPSSPAPTGDPQPAPVPVPEPVLDTPAPVVETPDPVPVEAPIEMADPELDAPVSDIPDLGADLLMDDPVDAAPAFEPAPRQPEPVKPKPAVIDALAEKCAWRTDIPGSPVRNIISGISLNDRILFINTLFKGDAQAFQATIALFNSYETLAQAEEFIRSNYPGWNLDSEVVYRFMMAVRRKLGR